MRVELKYFVALLLASTPALADFQSGNDLHEDCRSKIRHFLDGYVAGIVDWSNVNSVILQALSPSARAEAIERSKNVRFCVPPEVRLDQLTDIVCKALADEPQHRHLSAASTVGVAISRAYRCK